MGRKIQPVAVKVAVPIGNAVLKPRLNRNPSRGALFPES